jgi:uncharacterized protein (TIGR00725 family)
MNNTKKIQIGVMGSAADLNYSKEIENIAEQLGREIAQADCIYVFGAEKDVDSLSTVGARAAKKHGGVTVGITYGKGKETTSNADIIIPTGLERGGGREFTLVLSCDAIICISGGSGTLNEMTVAYQAGIPIVVIDKTGGWSEKLADSYMDERKRLKAEIAREAKEAVKISLDKLR